MQILHCTTKQAYEESKRMGVYGTSFIEREGFIHFSTWNSFTFVAPAFYKEQAELVLLCVESDDVSTLLKWEDGGEGIEYPHLYGALPLSSVREFLPFIHDDKQWLNKKDCTHVLMNIPSIDEDWCYSYLCKEIKKESRICMLAFSFFDNIKNAQDWEESYGEHGMWTPSYTRIWERYNITKEQITWVNYFQDSYQEMVSKIVNSDILFLPGGAPDLMMNRIKDFHLEEIIAQYQGIMIGCSAGAMIQLKHYHITPDVDYDHFSYEEGLPCLDNFEIEVHYTESEVQLDTIQKVQKETKKRLYAMYDNGGLLVKEGVLTTFGNVKEYK